MTINLDSTSDSKEAVTAALGDLAATKPVEEKPKEEPAEESEVEDAGEPEEDTEQSESEESVEEPSESEDDESEELEAKTEDETQEPKPKKKGGFQKRIDKLSKRVSLAEQEKEFWRQEALRAQQGKAVETPETKVPEIKPDLSTRPKVDDFDSHDAYVEALADWKVEQKLSARDQEQKVKEVKTETQTKFQKHQERVVKFAKSHDDWDEVIASVGNVSMSITVQEAIVSSEQGPELMYQLAKEPKELQRICSLSPVEAAMAIGEIKARFKKSSEPSLKKITKAPAPVKPVRTRGASTPKSIYDADKMSQREYEKAREEQLKSAR